MSRKPEVEIIEFTCPRGNRKNLFVRDIPALMSPEEMYMQLYQIFSKFGLLYEVQVFPSVSKPSFKGGKSAEQTMEPGYYAFVKFYSSMCAKQAKESLFDRLKFGENTAKISFAKRTKEQEIRTLPLDKCRELCNYYLGFNAWSSDIKLMKNVSENTSDVQRNVKFACFTEIKIPEHGLHSEGVGVWEEQYKVTDPASKLEVWHKVKKFSYHRSLVDAFRKLVIILLSNGKVSVEVNTTVPELLLKEAQYNEHELLNVNEMNEEPQLSDEENFPQSTEDIDDQNIQILQELEDG